MNFKVDSIFRPATWAITNLGLNEAIVLEELCFRQQHAVMKRGKLKWFFTPTSSIMDKKNQSAFPPLKIKFPWLSDKGIHKILDKLKKKKLIQISCFNQKAYDRTRWYHVLPQTVRRVKAGSKVQLSVQDAIDYGPAAALVLNRIRYEMSRNGCVWLLLNPEKVKHYIPLSESTIRRALKRLIAANELEKRPNQAMYKLVQSNPLAHTICGPATRKFTYYDEAKKGELTEQREYRAMRLNDKNESVEVVEKYFKTDRSAYLHYEMPEIQELKREIAEAFLEHTEMSMKDIIPEEEHYFEEAALICHKNKFNGTVYAHAQFEDHTYPALYMPELLIRDDAEQRYLAY